MSACNKRTSITTVPASEMSSVSIAIRIQEGIARITLNRPPLNVLDVEMLRRLNDALRECDATSIRVVVLGSAVPRAFSAGVEVRDHLANRLDAMLSEVRENARLLLNLKPVTIAAIHGSTLGGGAELALLCDIVLAGDDTVFGFPEITLGAFPPVAAACLPEMCGVPRAMQLLLGEPITAAAAEAAGLVSQVLPAAQFTETVERVAADLAAHSGVALRALTTATRGQRAPALLQRLDAAIATYRATVGPSRDAEEGISAFLEKRAPAWSHR
jgi:enoyl-CoA hydratase/carnithine racemase